MKLPFGLLAGVAGLSLMFAALPAYSQLSKEKEGKKSHLAELMDGVKDNMKQLGQSIAQSKEDFSEPLTHVAEIEKLLLMAKLEKPANLDELSADDQATHTLAFRRDMAQTIKLFLDLEIALTNGDKSGAMNLLKGPVNEAKKMGHQRYQKEDK